MTSGATGCCATSGCSACRMAAISPVSQIRLPAAVRDIWCCRCSRMTSSCGPMLEITPCLLACSLSYPRKNPGRCDLVHISLDGPVLDRRHEQRDPNLIRRAGRPPHRLRPDRHRRRRGSGCAGLSPAGLNPRSARPVALSTTSAARSMRFTASGLPRSDPVSVKIRQARRTLRLPIIHRF